MINSISPLIMLCIGAIIILFLVLLFLPKKGIIDRMKRVRTLNKRMLIEDALKYIFDCEYKKNHCEVNGIAGNLGISSNRASNLLQHLHDIGMIDVANTRVELTDLGRSNALRIIRIHRVWERYLADETGVDQLDWHKEADKMEHQLSESQINELAASMNHPAFDPHGDPIPSSQGELPESKGMVLNLLQEGDIARIIHIEDEPQNIYEQIMVLGLYPGMIIYLSDIKPNKITCVANGDECVLTPLFASGITVEILEDATLPETDNELLASLEVGQQAEIAGVSPNCRGQQRRRLMDMGIVPGSTIAAKLQGAFGDPVAYRVMGAMVAIRKKQAEMIFIRNRKKDETNKAY